MKRLAKWQRACRRCGRAFGPDEPRRADTDLRGNLARSCEPCWRAAFPPSAYLDPWDGA